MALLCSKDLDFTFALEVKLQFCKKILVDIKGKLFNQNVCVYI